MSFISDLCQIECLNMKGNIFIQTLHDKDLMWGTAMAFGMKIRSFVHLFCHDTEGGKP